MLVRRFARKTVVSLQLMDNNYEYAVVFAVNRQLGTVD